MILSGTTIQKLRRLLRADLKDEIGSLVELTRKGGEPNINALWMHLKELNAIKYSVKQQGYAIGNSVFEAIKLSEVPARADGALKLGWKPCTQADVESDWFRYWCDQLQSAPLPHRKLWEYTYILQNLFSYGLLSKGKRGLGFGCGQEPLPSFFASKDVSVTVTDLDPEKVKGKGWAETGQHTSTLDSTHFPNLVGKQKFLQLVDLEYVDMNEIPTSLDAAYDFCWSVCALEHLGSIAKGLQFIRNSLKCLRAGGVAIHTTEFNYTSNSETIDNWPTVLFLRQHFQALHDELKSEGLEVLPLSFDVGYGLLDSFVDIPPYDFDSFIKYRSEPFDGTGDYRPGHLKLSVDGFPSTCFGLTIVKR